MRCSQLPSIKSLKEIDCKVIGRTVTRAQKMGVSSPVYCSVDRTPIYPLIQSEKLWNFESTPHAPWSVDAKIRARCTRSGGLLYSCEKRWAEKWSGDADKSVKKSGRGALIWIEEIPKLSPLPLKNSATDSCQMNIESLPGHHDHTPKFWCQLAKGSDMIFSPQNSDEKQLQNVTVRRFATRATTKI
jgi:hypothetical protein